MAATTVLFWLVRLLLVWNEPLKRDYILVAFFINQVPNEPMQVAVVWPLVECQILTVLIKQVKLIGHVRRDQLFCLGLKLLFYD